MFAASAPAIPSIDPFPNSSGFLENLLAKRFSKNPEEFGKGSIEGIAGAEAANNAATGGAMVPTMVLGIPGSGTTAIILVGLMVHGLRPGVYLFTEQVEKVYQIFGSMFVANVMFMLMGPST